MNPAAARTLVVDTLGGIAPDIDLADLDGSADLRQAADLDSMDFLAYAAALSSALGADVPEQDYPHLRSIDAAVAYLVDRG